MQVKLKVLQGSRAGHEINISVPKFLIGRGEEAHLRPRSDLISRQHCEISVEDGKVMVRDLGSRNGTYVNNVRLSKPIQLKVGDELKIGKLEFEVVIDHSLGGSKKPKVESVREAAVRTAESAADPDNISSWLEEADQEFKDRRLSDPETRQFKLDETDRVSLEEASQTDTDAAALKEEEDTTESAKKKKKQEPGKLPPRKLVQSVDSSAAASDMLKKMFNRR